MRYEKELVTCKRLALEAGRRILEIYEMDIHVDYKEDDSPVTMADIEANEIIVSGLKSEFPDIPILSEESADDARRLESELVFIVDPLDGTKEFIKKNGEFTVNIALSRNKGVVMGVVYAPVKGELYYAVRGGGAFREIDGRCERIRVSKRKTNLRLLKSRSHNTGKYGAMIDRNISMIGFVERMGSSLKGCMIAAGSYDIYYNFGNTMIWDTAAVEAVVKEAGGVFAQLDDTDIDYSSLDVRNKKGFYILNSIENKLK